MIDFVDVSEGFSISKSFFSHNTLRDMGLTYSLWYEEVLNFAIEF